jgi:hypothetical protein
VSRADEKSTVRPSRVSPWPGPETSRTKVARTDGSGVLMAIRTVSPGKRDHSSKYAWISMVLALFCWVCAVRAGDVACNDYPGAECNHALSRFCGFGEQGKWKSDSGTSEKSTRIEAVC